MHFKAKVLPSKIFFRNYDKKISSDNINKIVNGLDKANYPDEL